MPFLCRSILLKNFAITKAIDGHCLASWLHGQKWLWIKPVVSAGSRYARRGTTAEGAEWSNRDGGKM